MYKYVAITTGTLLSCTELLRIGESGVIEQYDAKTEKWQNADGGLSGIYSGNVESEPITESEAKEIMQRWAKNAD